MSRARGLTLSSIVAWITCAIVPLPILGASSQGLTVEQIIEKNVAARGGLDAWRGIQTMTISGKMDAGSKQNIQLPFVMSLKRPRMSRLEIEFGGATAVQVYDGTNGWKVRPFLGRNEVETFTRPEMQQAAEQQDLDGVLIDHQAKGIKVELLGVEAVEGHDAYKLNVTMPTGNTRHLWVDAQSFLEVKFEGFPRTLDGKLHSVAVFYRNYGPAGNVKVPYLLETVVEGVPQTRKLVIETVVMNPKLDEHAFARPELTGGITSANAQRRTARVQSAPLNAKRAERSQ